MDIEHTIPKQPELAASRPLLEAAPLASDFIDFDQIFGNGAEPPKTAEPEQHFTTPKSHAESAALGLNVAEPILRPAGPAKLPLPPSHGDIVPSIFSSENDVTNSAAPKVLPSQHAAPDPGNQFVPVKLNPVIPTVEKAAGMPNVSVDGAVLSAAIADAKSPHVGAVGKPEPVTEMQHSKQNLRPANEAVEKVATNVRAGEIHVPPPRGIGNGSGPGAVAAVIPAAPEVLHPINRPIMAMQGLPESQVPPGPHDHMDVPKPVLGAVPEHSAGSRAAQATGGAFRPDSVPVVAPVVPAPVPAGQPEIRAGSKDPKQTPSQGDKDIAAQVQPKDIPGADRIQRQTGPAFPLVPPPNAANPDMPRPVLSEGFDPAKEKKPAQPTHSGEQITTANGPGDVHDTITAPKPPSAQVAVSFNLNENSALHMQSSPDPEGHLEVTVLEPARSQSTAPVAGTNAPPVAADYSPRVIQMIAESARALADKPVELTLSPEELGKVKLTLQTGEGSVVVAISAERAETLELLRRNIDQLAAQFREIGYQDLSFQFAGQGNPDNGQLSPDSSEAPDQPNSESSSPSLSQDVHRLTLRDDGRVDIRL